MSKSQLGNGVIIVGDDGVPKKVVGVQAATIAALTDNSAGVAGNAIAAGVGKRSFSFVVNNADVAAGDLFTAYTPGFAGKILAINAFAVKPASTAAKAATLTPKINSTNVTGGAVALTTAALTTQGAKVAGSAITAANVFTATDTIGLVASAVTAFVEGATLVVIDVQNTDERDAFASLAGKFNADLAMEKAHGLLA